MKSIKFSINSHDKDGNIYETGIYLHFDETRIRICKSLDEFELIVDHLKYKVLPEIKENYK